MEPDVLRRIGAGELVLLDDGQAYGREQKVADELNNQLLDLAKWVRRMTGWNKRVVPVKLWRKKIQPLLEEKLAEHHTPVVRFHRSEYRLMVHVRLDFQSVQAHVDSHGVAMIRPPERQVVNATCAACTLHAECRELKPATGVAFVEATAVGRCRWQTHTAGSHGRFLFAELRAGHCGGIGGRNDSGR